MVGCLVIGPYVGHIAQPNLFGGYPMGILFVVGMDFQFGSTGISQGFTDLGGHILRLAHKNHDAVLQLQYAIILARHIVRCAFRLIAQGI